MTQLNEVVARVEKIYPKVERETSNGPFITQKVLVVFNEENEYPSKIVLEQSGKKIDIVGQIEEGKRYTFSLNFRGNTWTDKNGIETAFGSVSAWRVEPEEEERPMPF